MPLQPLLAINKNNNTATILHCLAILYPPLGGYQGRHLATSLMLALARKAFYPGGTLDIVSIPDYAFADVQVWHATTMDKLVAVNPPNCSTPTHGSAHRHRQPHHTTAPIPGPLFH